MITTYILCFFTGYLGVLMGLRLALDKVAVARHRVSSLQRDRVRQVAAIREVAKGCRTAKRKAADSDMLVGRLTAEVAKLEEKLKTVRKSDNRLVVLDERRLPEDHRWIVVISGAGGALPEATGEEGNENWSGNLRFLVWATTMERAVKKAATRFPPSRGFKIEVATTPNGAAANGSPSQPTAA
ncbi:hypothetical protein JL100_013170 [Skermanella mucosa]|uniref:hypothetical protein n=1 Tax=Skermanella mucosa TaxID=1789672 RepID=UPI00192B777C|nr:hypothetical protein [Skermanella mucosa]UEM23640.1 hypothetical protein JL100_013170 [Skermanella mucosa]